eukprot:scaffold221957_cov18-Tisochrysis_lutea.AAC.1
MPYLINTFNLENANFSRTIASPLARAPSLCVQTPCPAHILGLLLPAQKKGSAAARPARWPPPHGWECHLTGIAAAGAVAAAAPDGYATMLPATWPAAVENQAQSARQGTARRGKRGGGGVLRHSCHVVAVVEGLVSWYLCVVLAVASSRSAAFLHRSSLKSCQPQQSSVPGAQRGEFIREEHS